MDDLVIWGLGIWIWWLVGEGVKAFALGKVSFLTYSIYGNFLMINEKLCSMEAWKGWGEKVFFGRKQDSKGFFLYNLFQLTK